MIELTCNDAANAWTVYTIQDKQGNLLFIWYSRLANVLGMQDVVKNPALANDVPVTLKIYGFYPSKKLANNAVSSWLKNNPWPPMNKTQHINHYVRVRCNETGVEYRNAAEAAKILDINAGALSQHLRRAPGYKTLKGMTFSAVGIYTNDMVKPVRYPAPELRG